MHLWQVLRGLAAFAHVFYGSSLWTCKDPARYPGRAPLEKITSSSSTDYALEDAIYRGHIAVFKVIKVMAAESYEDDTPRSFPTI
ncbi:hypothetical protein ACG7TL_002249 [Trametes sanguinea]